MKNHNCAGSMSSQIAIGVVVIGIGLLFLLDNLGFLEFRQAATFWPLVLIFVGAVKFFDRQANSRVVGGVMIVAGALFLFKRLGLFYVSWQTVWPLGLIVVGALVVYRAMTGRAAITASLKGEATSDDVVDATAILGGFERRIQTTTFRGGDVTAIMGGCALDMRGSSIQGEAVLNVFAALGGITIKVPPDWTVVLHGTPILGGFEEKTATPPDGAKRLIVTGYAIMGGVEVRN
jgi:predicted membrane protein